MSCPGRSLTHEPDGTVSALQGYLCASRCLASRAGNSDRRLPLTAAEMKSVSTGSTCGTRDITAALNTICAHLLRSVGRCGNQSCITDADGCKVETSASTVL